MGPHYPGTLQLHPAPAASQINAFSRAVVGAWRLSCFPQGGQGPPEEAPAPLTGSSWGHAQPCLCQPDLFHGYVLPFAQRYVYFEKKKKKKRQNQKGEMASRALRSSKINDVVKGKLSSNHSAGEVLSRHGTGTWGLVCSSSEGTRSTWRGQRGIHGAVGSTGQCSQRGQQHIPSAPCSPCTVAPWPQPLLRLSPQRGDEWEPHGSCQK